MRLPTNSASDGVIGHLQRLSVRQSQLQTQISTGQKIFEAGDNPAAMGRLLTMDVEKRQLQQYQRNSDHAMDLSQAVYTGLTQLQKLSTRAGELATLGSGLTSTESAKAYAAEVNQLLEQAVQLGNTRFRNDYVFAGTATDTAPIAATRDFGGRVTGATYAGNTGRAQIALSESASIAPGTTNDTNVGIRDFIGTLITLRDALEANDPATIAAAQPDLETAETSFINGISEQGAVQLRIEVNQAQQKARFDNLEKLVSGEADIDLPETMVRLSQTTTAYEAALSSATKILQMSLLDYLR